MSHKTGHIHFFGGSKHLENWVTNGLTSSELFTRWAGVWQLFYWRYQYDVQGYTWSQVREAITRLEKNLSGAFRKTIHCSTTSNSLENFQNQERCGEENALVFRTPLTGKSSFIQRLKTTVIFWITLLCSKTFEPLKMDHWYKKFIPIFSTRWSSELKPRPDLYFHYNDLQNGAILVTSLSGCLMPKLPKCVFESVNCASLPLASDLLGFYYSSA